MHNPRTLARLMIWEDSRFNGADWRGSPRLIRLVFLRPARLGEIQGILLQEGQNVAPEPEGSSGATTPGKIYDANK